jgi:hypothetical protein
MGARSTCAFSLYARWNAAPIDDLPGPGCRRALRHHVELVVGKNLGWMGLEDQDALVTSLPSTELMGG